MRLALDTNILAYAEGIGDLKRCKSARDLVARLAGPACHRSDPMLGRTASGVGRKSRPRRSRGEDLHTQLGGRLRGRRFHLRSNARRA